MILPKLGKTKRLYLLGNKQVFKHETAENFQKILLCDALVKFCSLQNDFVITFVSLLEFARIILNILESYALFIKSAALVFNYGELFIELLLLELLSVVMIYVNINRPSNSRHCE